MTFQSVDRRSVSHDLSTAMLPRLRSARRSGTIRLASAAAVSLMVANCSQQTAGSSIDPRYGVAASPRVVAEGDPVPKGGGRDLVGRPYTVAGKTYFPRENPRYAAEGLASWYGANFHGRLTANGEVFDRYAIAAAHTTMPLPSYARVTNTENGRSIVVRVNDRGPYHDNRIIDVSQVAAEALDFRRKGTARVRVEYVGRASPNGSDDRVLLASLRTDGRPATLPTGMSTLVAFAQTRRDVPRQTLALRSYGQDAVGETEVLSAGAGASWQPAVTRTVVPLPPERPFDLGKPSNGPTPVPLASAGAGARPAGRPIVAGLYFAPAPIASASLDEGNAFRPVGREDVVGLNLRR